VSQSPIQIPADRLAEIQKHYVEGLTRLLSSPEEATRLVKADRRFSSDSWVQSGPFAQIAALYVLNSKAMHEMASALTLDHKTQQRVEFMVEQLVDAVSPANFLATNPDAQQKLLESKGESLRQGMDNLLHDLSRGRITQSDESGFVVGENLALTPGDVIYECPLFQLIHYRPRTEKVGTRPLLMVPPCINKFYIMDLQPGASLVEFALDQGQDVYLVSWKNPGESERAVSWDNYIQDGVVHAIDMVLEASGRPTINLLGFCVGGTLCTTSLGVLAARDESDKVHSLTLMTTLIDFSETGVLDVFIDEQHVSMREQTLGEGGLLPGKELAATFSFLRPNDLVWPYVVKNYLKGETPPAFDILYWNADSTNLPGPFYAWYLRNTYLENNLVKPGKLTVAGESLDLRQVKQPVYAFGAREDHIVPWQSAWEGVRHLGGKARFVLGASGHIAGAINPASKNKRSYWTNARPGADAEDWFGKAEEHAGSWWNDWSTWIRQHQGPLVAAPKPKSRGRFKPIEPAPGRYVKERTV
jgi:polyhydroxyalkanoate synthase